MGAPGFAEYGCLSCESMLSFLPREQYGFRREKKTERAMEERCGESRGALPTALSSIMPWALVRAAAVAPDILALEPKKRRRNEIVGERRGDKRLGAFCFSN